MAHLTLEQRYEIELWQKAGKGATAIAAEIGRDKSVVSRELKKLSSNFARGATGTVDVFQNANGVRISSIWAQTEYKLLIQNNRNIIYHTIFP